MRKPEMGHEMRRTEIIRLCSLRTFAHAFLLVLGMMSVGIVAAIIDYISKTH